MLESVKLLRFNPAALSIEPVTEDVCVDECFGDGIVDTGVREPMDAEVRATWRVIDGVVSSVVYDLLPSPMWLVVTSVCDEDADAVLKAT